MTNCNGECYHLFRRAKAKDAISGKTMDVIDGRNKKIEMLEKKKLEQQDQGAIRKLEEAILLTKKANQEDFMFAAMIIDTHDRYHSGSPSI